MLSDYRLLIRSQDRSTDSVSPSNCRIDFKTPLYVTDVKEAKLLYFQMYNTKLNIDTTNNRVDFNENFTNKTATLTSGYYTTNTLATELQTQLNNASGGFNAFTVTYSSVTRKFTISATNSFSLRFSTGSNRSVSPFKLLGWTTSNGLSPVDSSAGTSAVAPFACNLSSPLSYYFYIAELGDAVITTNNVKATFYIPANNSSGGMLEYKSKDFFDQIINIHGNKNFSNTLNKLSINVYDESGSIVDLNNSEWEILLEFN